ncbi:MAG: hypothetical protein RL410_141, partial [Actinomycetota bacterium]
MRKWTAAIALTLLLAACAAPVTEEEHHHLTTPQVNVDEAKAATYGGTLLNSPLTDEISKISFTDQNGNTFTLNDFKGKTVVLTNFLTSCQDAGPLTSLNIKQIAKQTADSVMVDDVVFLEITVDSDTDTAQRLKAYEAVFGFTPNVLLATTTATSLDKLWNFFGVPATKHVLSKADLDFYNNDWQTGAEPKFHFMHANLVAVIDANLTWRWMQSGNPDVAKLTLPATMQKFLSPD